MLRPSSPCLCCCCCFSVMLSCVSEVATPRSSPPPHLFLFLSPYLVPPCLTHRSGPSPLPAGNAELIIADAVVTYAACEIRTPGIEAQRGAASFTD